MIILSFPDDWVGVYPGDYTRPEYTDLFDFLNFFYDTFLAPIHMLLLDTEVLGFSLYFWLFGFAWVAIAVRFFAALFGLDIDKK